MTEGPKSYNKIELSPREVRAERLALHVLTDLTALENEYIKNTVVNPYYVIADALREQAGALRSDSGDDDAVLSSVYMLLAEMYDSLHANHHMTMEDGLNSIVSAFPKNDIRVMIFDKLRGNKLGERLEKE